LDCDTGNCRSCDQQFIEPLFLQKIEMILA